MSEDSWDDSAVPFHAPTIVEPHENLAISSKEVIVHVEKEGGSARTCRHRVRPVSRTPRRWPVVQGEGELLNRRRSGFPDVVPTDADRMPFGEMLGTVGDRSTIKAM